MKNKKKRNSLVSSQSKFPYSLKRGDKIDFLKKDGRWVCAKIDRLKKDRQNIPIKINLSYKIEPIYSIIKKNEGLRVKFSGEEFITEYKDILYKRNRYRFKPAGRKAQQEPNSFKTTLKLRAWKRTKGDKKLYFIIDYSKQPKFNSDQKNKHIVGNCQVPKSGKVVYKVVSVEQINDGNDVGSQVCVQLDEFNHVWIDVNHPSVTHCTTNYDEAIKLTQIDSIKKNEKSLSNQSIIHSSSVDTSLLNINLRHPEPLKKSLVDGNDQDDQSLKKFKQAKASRHKQKMVDADDNRNLSVHSENNQTNSLITKDDSHSHEKLQDNRSQDIKSEPKDEYENKSESPLDKDKQSSLTLSESTKSSFEKINDKRKNTMKSNGIGSNSGQVINGGDDQNEESDKPKGEKLLPNKDGGRGSVASNNDELERLRIENNNLQDCINKLKIENRSALNKYNEIEMSYDNEIKRNKNLEETIASLNEENATQSRKIVSLSKKCSDLEETVNRTTNKLHKEMKKKVKLAKALQTEKERSKRENSDFEDNQHQQLSVALLKGYKQELNQAVNMINSKNLNSLKFNKGLGKFRLHTNRVLGEACGAYKEKTKQLSQELEKKDQRIRELEHQLAMLKKMNESGNTHHIINKMRNPKQASENRSQADHSHCSGSVNGSTYPNHLTANKSSLHSVPAYTNSSHSNSCSLTINQLFI